MLRAKCYTYAFHHDSNLKMYGNRTYNLKIKPTGLRLQSTFTFIKTTFFFYNA